MIYLQKRCVPGKGGVRNASNMFSVQDGEFLRRHSALETARIRPIETGGCPHAAIREAHCTIITHSVSICFVHISNRIFEHANQ
jgi:hypothetical protein